MSTWAIQRSLSISESTTRVFVLPDLKYFYYISEWSISVSASIPTVVKTTFVNVATSSFSGSRISFVGVDSKEPLPVENSNTASSGAWYNGTLGSVLTTIDTVFVDSNAKSFLIRRYKYPIVANAKAFEAVSLSGSATITINAVVIKPEKWNSP